MSYAVPLFSYQEAPRYLHGNPYIKTGYRGYLPLKLCLRSLFMWTNETLNVWSHFLVGLYCFLLYHYDLMLVREFPDSTVYDSLSFVLMVLCIQVCMFASSLYHLFNCQSEQRCKSLLLLDFVGITIGLSGCFFPVMHYAFYCFPNLKLYYGVAIGAIFGVAAWCVGRPWFGTKEYVYHRIVIYALLSLSGIIPSTHWSILYGINSEAVMLFIPRIILLYALAALGAFFYITRIPESIFPGRFDYIGHSHQLWHVCAALIFIIGHQTQVKLFFFVKSTECPP